MAATTEKKLSRQFLQEDFPDLEALDAYAVRWHRLIKSRELDRILRRMGIAEGLTPALIDRITRGGIELDAALYYLDYYDQEQRRLLAVVETDISEDGGVWTYTVRIQSDYL